MKNVIHTIIFLALALMASSCAPTVLQPGLERYLHGLEKVSDTADALENKAMATSQSRFFPFFANGSYQEARLNYIGNLIVYEGKIIFQPKGSGTDWAMPDLTPILISIEKISEWKISEQDGLSLLLKYDNKHYLFLIKSGGKIIPNLKTALADRPKGTFTK